MASFQTVQGEDPSLCSRTIPANQAQARKASVSCRAEVETNLLHIPKRRKKPSQAPPTLQAKEATHSAIQTAKQAQNQTFTAIQTSQQPVQDLLPWKNKEDLQLER